MSRLVLIALVLASGVATADDELDIAGRDSVDLRGDALVWEDAPLHLEPWEGGTSVRLATFGRGRTDEVGRAFPVKIVSATMRDFVEIELVEAAACTWHQVATDDRLDALRLYVRRADLAPVLVKPFAITYPDGTGVRLAPGIPVLPTHAGGYVVALRGDQLKLPIPHRSVGYVYPRGRIDEPPEPRQPHVRLDRGVVVELGGASFPTRAGWLATKPPKAGDNVLLRWSARCIELVVSAPSRSLRGVPLTGLFGTAGLGVSGGPHHTVPAGAPLSTPGGREVAVAARPIRVAAPTDGKSCFDAQLTLERLDEVPMGSTTRGFRLCVPANLLDPPPPPAPPPAPAPRPGR